MITEKKFQECAKTLKVEVAAVKAVAEVESGGSGFLSTGEPVILFEPHIFWKELRKLGWTVGQLEVLRKKHPDILYPVWGSKPYGKSSQQHARLNRAVLIHRFAALQSASWGKFQIMGFNWKATGAKNLQQFINWMYSDEDFHLTAFCNYISASFLDDELRAKDWKAFARAYNGPGYWKNKYDTKLLTAYNKYKNNA
jgi:hypothetical protein